ncbi:right-handed parallel beta-helix repeat-containing protein [bacterium]|nr:right-handed parallel beta-helix repeat-containing protein [candidate division CSSED10-310 bacterium]
MIAVTWISFLLFEGAVPRVVAVDFYIDAERGDDAFSGMSWETAKRTLEAVFENTLAPGDRLHVAQGVYRESVTMLPGIEMLGGYASGGGERASALYPSVIDGEDTRRCVTGADGALLDGFVLTDGRAPQGGGMIHSSVTMHVHDCVIRNCVTTDGSPHGGGGMYFFLSSSLVTQCVFENNRSELDASSKAAEAVGGAVMCWAASPWIHGCTFRNNQVVETPQTALCLGGAIWASASAPVIVDCLFESNSAVTAGAVGWWNRSTPVVENCVFVNNVADAAGGGVCHIYNESSIPETESWVRDCRFTGNRADTGGAIMITRNNRVVLSNCVFENNSAWRTGSAVAVESSSMVNLHHCTAAFNRIDGDGDAGGCIAIDATSSMVMEHSIIVFNAGSFGVELQDGGDPLNQEVINSNVYGHPVNVSPNAVDRTGWFGNISVNPLFIDDPDYPFYLSDPATGDATQTAIGRSPCIDAAGHDVPGYPQQDRSTRTDRVPDRGPADMGAHRPFPGPYLVASSPFSGQYAVPVDADIRGRLMQLPTHVSTGDITVTINDIPIPVELTPIWSGFEYRVATIEPLQANTDYRLIFSVAFTLGTRDFESFFSTGPEPEQPDPPTGTHLTLNFPMVAQLYGAGDRVDILLDAINPWLNPVPVDVHIALVYGSDAFIFPEWDQQLHPMQIELDPGDRHTIEILSFIVPDGIPPGGPFVFYGLCTFPGEIVVTGDIAMWSMEFID